MKILIVQTAFLGDTVLTTPIFKALRARYPEAQLWFVGTPAGVELVRRDPLLAGVIPFDKRGRDAGARGLWRFAQRLRSERFDRVYAVQRSARTSLLVWLAGIPERIGYRSARGSWLYTRRMVRPVDGHDVERNLTILGDERGGGDGELRLFPPPLSELPGEVTAVLPPAGTYVVLAPGSAWRTKRWDQSHYAAVAQSYTRAGVPVVVVGAPEEREVCAAVASASGALDLAGKTSVAACATVIAGAKVLVCNDSVALHIGSALKVPTVAVFCATSPRFGFGPWRNQATVVEHTELACKPCRRHGSRVCPTGTEACMRDVPPERVLRAAAELERGVVA